ncbi:hypothetical protein BJ944DRAFT_243281 [Cunninghamella echinulata]|nr:hypothetical protein BJ944DRAFT_243281 [Cunninghamella echinulata]
MTKASSTITTTTMDSTQEPLLTKLKTGLYKLIGKRNTSISHHPNKRNHASTYQQGRKEEEEEEEEKEEDQDEQEHINTALKYNLYSKDDCFERNRYLKTSYHHHERRPSTISIQTVPTNLYQPPSILMNNNNNNNNKSPSSPSSHHHYTHHRHTSSLQSGSVISTPSSTRPSSHFHHVRNYSHVSYLSASNITMNSEDLTAKEFADMAGIKIIPDDDNDDDRNDHYLTDYSDNHHHFTTTTSTLTRTNTNNTSYTVNSHHTTTGHTTPHSSSSSYHRQQHRQQQEGNWSIISCDSSKSQSNPTRIWDQQFWSKPGTEEKKEKENNKVKNDINDGGDDDDDDEGITTTIHINKTISSPIPTSILNNSSNTTTVTSPQLPSLPNNNNHNYNGKTLRKHRSAMFQHRQTLSLPPPIPPITSSKMRYHHGKSKSTCDLPIVHELRRMHSLSIDHHNHNNNNSSNNNNDFVMKKGRFEIQYESPLPLSSTTPSSSSS